MNSTNTNLIRFSVLLAVIAGVIFLAAIGPSRVNAQQAPEVIIDCYDPELEAFVPCEDLDIDIDVDTPSQCPEGTTPVTNAAGKWTCIDIDTDDCQPNATHGFGNDCIPTFLTCERVAVAIDKKVDLPQHILDWYEEHCTRDRFTCREIAYKINNGLRITREERDWYERNCQREECPEYADSTVYGYNEDCDEPRYTCRDIAKKIAQGRATAEERDWYLENCTDDEEECPEIVRRHPAGAPLPVRDRDDCDGDTPEVTCDDLQKRIDAGYQLPPEWDAWYQENCTNPRWDCEDLERILADGGRLTDEQQAYYDRYCDDDRTKYTCEELLELGFISQEQYDKFCDNDTPDCEDCDCDECPKKTPKCEETGDCKVLIPPKTGTGAFFDTMNSTGSLGLMSIILIAAGGAVAGTLLRRKA